MTKSYKEQISKLSPAAFRRFPCEQAHINIKKIGTLRRDTNLIRHKCFWYQEPFTIIFRKCKCERKHSNVHRYRCTGSCLCVCIKRKLGHSFIHRRNNSCLTIFLLIHTFLILKYYPGTFFNFSCDVML